jgi:multidrug efflux pump subunit AcrB
MMWLVRVALKRPLSVAVMALLMLLLGGLSFASMNVDIFPAINIPVVMVIWQYPGLSPIDVERRIVNISERATSTTVNGIEHIDSESMLSNGVVKIYFYPDADIASPIAQINAISSAILFELPRGTEPPLIVSYNASNVPVAQLNVYSDTLPAQRLFDYAFNFMRLQLFTIPGFSSPGPLGGVQRAVMVNIDPTQLYANNVSANDIGNSLATSNVIIPSGTARISHFEYHVDINLFRRTIRPSTSLRSWRL